MDPNFLMGGIARADLTKADKLVCGSKAEYDPVPPEAQEGECANGCGTLVIWPPNVLQPELPKWCVPCALAEAKKRQAEQRAPQVIAVAAIDVAMRLAVKAGNHEAATESVMDFHCAGFKFPLANANMDKCEAELRAIDAAEGGCCYHHGRMDGANLVLSLLYAALTAEDGGEELGVLSSAAVALIRLVDDRASAYVGTRPDRPRPEMPQSATTH
jgi:hypothetical protein